MYLFTCHKHAYCNLTSGVDANHPLYLQDHLPFHRYTIFFMPIKACALLVPGAVARLLNKCTANSFFLIMMTIFIGLGGLEGEQRWRRAVGRGEGLPGFVYERAPGAGPRPATRSLLHHINRRTGAYFTSPRGWKKRMSWAH